MLLLTGILIKSNVLLAAEVSISKTNENSEDNLPYYRYIEDSTNTVHYITNSYSLSDSLMIGETRATTETKAFTYNFSNYVDVAYVFHGSMASSITFKFNTNTWSNSNGFYVGAYEYKMFGDDTFLYNYYVSKATGNPKYITFTLDEDKQYTFRFENTKYGESIVGSGEWTVTYR